MKNYFDERHYPVWDNEKIEIVESDLNWYAEPSQQVDDITNQLKEKGVHILYKEKHLYAAGDDYYAVYFEDPDRIKVELVAP
uniref:hypothetical protein n=1 Tax=Bacillus shivajii TaxID=1983719 RepID=UPI00299CD933|nr:hypothetical protein [Bacillus shivajii]